MYPRIRDLREDAELSQTQVLIRLVKFYHVSVDYLLGLSEQR